jgi:hypothetical protein
MELVVAQIDLKEDFPVLERFWEERNFPSPPPEFLPPTGLLVKYEDTIVCAGFLFKTDAKVACIGHLISNPSTPGVIRNSALNLLLVSLESIARKEGFGMISSSTNLERLMRRYEKLGFIKTDDNVSHFGRIV